MKKSIIFILVCSSLFSKTITFQEALSKTIQNNKELKAKKYDIDLSEQNLKEAQSYDFGNLNFKETVSNSNNPLHVFGMKLSSHEAALGDFGFSNYSFSNIIPSMIGDNQEIGLIEPEALNYPGSRTNFETKVVYEVPLFTGFKLDSAKTMAELQILANKAKYSLDEKEIGLEVIKAYNGAVAAKKFIDLTQNGLVITKRLEKLSNNLYENGLARQLDVSQAQMATSAIITKRNEAKTQYKLALAYLKFLTGDKEIDNVNQFVSFENTMGLESLQEAALADRDDLTWMEKNRETMSKKIDFENASLYPTVGFHAEYGFNDDKFTAQDNKDNYVVAVQLEYNLFDGGLSKSRREKAKLEHAKTTEYQGLMEEGILLEVEKNFSEYTSLKQNLVEKRKTQKMAEQILAETEETYKNNLKFRTNMMYLLMSFENMLKAQGDVITTEYMKALTSAQLQLSIGKDLRR
ncbi:MAG: hypothetical protein RL113_1145 [Pseudomonadota bacterium]